MSNKSIGQRIMELRKKNHYTREQLATKANISTKFLYEVEFGKKQFSANVLSRLADSLSVSCDYIMFGEKMPNSEIYQLEILLNQINDKDFEVILKIISILQEAKNTK